MAKKSPQAGRDGAGEQKSDLYLTAEQVAESLGISLATVYVYVTRKLLRSEAIPGTRQRRYWLPDVERLKQGKSAGGANARDEALASQTRITLLSDAGVYYRGKDAIELSRSATFEEVAGLLWQADPAIFNAPLAVPGKALEPMLVHTRGWPCVDRAISMLPLIERENVRCYDLSHGAYTRTGVDVLRWLTAFTLGRDAPQEGLIHEVLARHLKAPQGFDDVIRQLLVLSADHQIEQLAYAVRAVANVGVTPYMAVLTGLVASQGQWLVASREIGRFVDEIVSSRHGAEPVISRLRSGEPLPGYGGSAHTVDPRLQALTAALHRWNGDDPDVIKFQQALDCAAETTDKAPRLVLPAMLVGRKLGLIGQELAVASLGRVAGWLAHAFEQQQMADTTRARPAYVGSLP